MCLISSLVFAAADKAQCSRFCFHYDTSVLYSLIDVRILQLQSNRYSNNKDHKNDSRSAPFLALLLPPLHSLRCYLLC